MYGGGLYGQQIYGSDQIGASVIVTEPSLVIEPPFVIAPFTVYAPAVSYSGEQILTAPLITATLQVFAPAISIATVVPRGRPIAEDIRIMSVNSKEATSGFHASLGSSLYRNSIERERRVLFGADAICTLYSLTPGAGEAVLITLRDYWSARRIPTIESGAIEQWRLEIASSLVNWEMLANVSTVLIEPDTGEVQRYRVMQTENAMKPGHVYHLRIEAIAQL